MAQCICICPNPDGTFSAHVEEYDGGQEGQTFQSTDELMAALPSLLQEAAQGGEEEPMLEGEAEMRAMGKGFDSIRGKGMGY